MSNLDVHIYEQSADLVEDKWCHRFQFFSFEVKFAFFLILNSLKFILYLKNWAPKNNVS